MKQFFIAVGVGLLINSTTRLEDISLNVFEYLELVGNLADSDLGQRFIRGGKVGACLAESNIRVVRIDLAVISGGLLDLVGIECDILQVAVAIL